MQESMMQEANAIRDKTKVTALSRPAARSLSKPPPVKSRSMHSVDRSEPRMTLSNQDQGFAEEMTRESSQLKSSGTARLNLGAAFGSRSGRYATSSIPNRDYLLELADSSRPSAAGVRDRRVQQHPAKFQCTLCPKRFTRAYNLRSHIDRTHLEQSQLPPPNNMPVSPSISGGALSVAKFEPHSNVFHAAYASAYALTYAPAPVPDQLVGIPTSGDDAGSRERRRIIPRSLSIRSRSSSPARDVDHEKETENLAESERKDDVFPNLQTGGISNPNQALHSQTFTDSVYSDGERQWQDSSPRFPEVPKDIRVLESGSFGHVEIYNAPQREPEKIRQSPSQIISQARISLEPAPKPTRKRQWGRLGISHRLAGMLTVPQTQKLQGLRKLRTPDGNKQLAQRSSTEQEDEDEEAAEDIPSDVEGGDQIKKTVVELDSVAKRESDENVAEGQQRRSRKRKLGFSTDFDDDDKEDLNEPGMKKLSMIKQAYDVDEGDEGGERDNDGEEWLVGGTVGGIDEQEAERR
ncbi:MAG: hypothetical protein Q9181_006845, partial [Wetmoreana brouardii]